jgi:hypothetical protein
MAALSREVYGRMGTLPAVGDAARLLVADVEDQFRRIAQMGDAQREYLQGVIEFYQTRTNTKINESTHISWLVGLLVFMSAMSVAMLVRARRQGWW